MSRLPKIGIAAAGIVAIVLVAYYLTRGGQAPEVVTQPITRGNIEETVAATGNLEAVTTVQVGTQVSGTIQQLNADFNTQVRKGQVIAKLDPSLFQTQVDQARANLDRSEADLEQLRLTAADTQRKLDRARKLFNDKLIATEDFDTAQAAALTASAQVRSAEAQVTQARASLSQAQVNLEKTVITAPINGIVIARNVDVGQTVAASFQAPTLFVIAADLTKMQVNAAVNEADIGRVRAGQAVRFRVDAYPDAEFPGTVSLVRLNPIVQQNVVTYATLIDVPNPELRLKPGMTATVTIQIAKRENVLRVPNVALRFRPTEDMFAALGQPAPQVAHLSRDRDQGFGEVPVLSSEPEQSATVWQYMDGRLVPVNIKLGITDGVYTELRSPGLEQGTELVTAFVTDSASATSPTTNPLLGPQRPGRGPR